VAVTVALGAEDRTLLLSGPNAGGKTVALETIGLASLMAQSGIPVCASEAVLPLFAQVRADIGDHQS
jgi:DNA mismatch repair protein MutS2